MAKSKGKNKLLFIGKIILIINWFFALGLLLSFSAHFISPLSIVYFAFLGLAFPYFASINILFVLYWIIRLRKQLLISLIALIISFPTLNKFIAFRSTINDQRTTSSFKVLSYNVHNFDIYNYNKHWVSNTEKRNKIFSYITYESPDIICFQEFVDDLGGRFKILDTLPYFQKANNFHFEYTKAVRKLNYFGIATFTKFPIVNKGKILFGPHTNNICIYTDINVNGKIIRIFNTHFQSIRFNEDDYEFADRIKDVDKIKDDSLIGRESKKILKRLKKAFFKRAEQVEIVEKYIKSSPYPVIVCGDFNDTPSSYAYYTVSKTLSDAFCESGKGLGQTYSGNSFPSFRIDYILHSKSLNSQKIHYRKRCLFRPQTCDV